MMSGTRSMYTRRLDEVFNSEFPLGYKDQYTIDEAKGDTML